MSLAINPETKVGALLDAYPGIEEQLIAWVPAFSKLRNPVLRKTVAKVATLEQAAKIGGIGARELVARLRAAAGQPDAPLPAAQPDASAGGPPPWVREDMVRHAMDADAMLETGEHPIGKIRRFAETLEPGAVIRLTSSFRPVPLIDTMRRGGLDVWYTETAPGRHVTYFTRVSA